MATPREICDAKWQRQKAAICQLYIDKDLPLPRVVDEMARVHNFKRR